MSNDSFLFGVCIEQEAVGVKASRVRITRVYRCVTLSHYASCVRIPADCIEKRVVENSGGAHHVRCDITQIGNCQRGNDHGAVDVRDEPVQPIERPVGAERPVVIGQGDERPLIKCNTKLVGELAGESGIKVQRTRQLNLEIVPFAMHRNRTQQHRGREMLVAVRPGHETDSEEHGVDSACCGEFDRFVVDSRGVLAGAVKRNIIANEVP
ncbi:unannotated protein [freshwater metagenome]|uniref:Unannotated protein n=1 Tax=freshwater metagenome TaxID=449393 RepID=A0A6J7DN69_9ZZZZ